MAHLTPQDSQFAPKVWWIFIHSVRNMVHHKYLVHGVCLESNVEFSEFTPHPSGAPDITLMREPSPPAGFGALPETAILLKGYHRLPQGGTGSFSYCGFSGHYLVRWDQLCDFQVSRDGSWITCQPWAGVPWSDIRPFVLGRVLPLALNLRGTLTLHSGAVLLPHGAIALVAESGTGKSTLAANLACSGYTLIADDVLAVTENHGRFYVELGYSYVRLTGESLDVFWSGLPAPATVELDYDKSRVYMRGQVIGTSPMPLQAIYLLKRRPREEGGNVRISTLLPQKALPGLIGNINNAILLERHQLGQQFLNLGRLADQVPVKIRTFPPSSRGYRLGR